MTNNIADTNHDELLKRAVDSILNGEGALSGVEIDELTHRYPYFMLPVATYLKDFGKRLDETERQRLTHRLALTSSNPGMLYMLVDPASADHAHFYPDEQPQRPSTRQTIDTFLETYGKTSPEEEELLNRMIFNPAPDYAQILAKEEEESLPARDEAPAGSDDERLNRFILQQKEHAGVIGSDAPVAAETVENRHSTESAQPIADDTMLSESLARIFIKQHQYQRAYEIISQLSLNYPEKSVYFADQLRFLGKVIENRRLRNEAKNK